MHHRSVVPARHLTLVSLIDAVSDDVVGLKVFVRVAEELNVLLVRNHDASLFEFIFLSEAFHTPLAETHMPVSYLSVRLE